MKDVGFQYVDSDVLESLKREEGIMRHFRGVFSKGCCYSHICKHNMISHAIIRILLLTRHPISNRNYLVSTNSPYAMECSVMARLYMCGHVPNRIIICMFFLGQATMIAPKKNTLCLYTGQNLEFYMGSNMAYIVTNIENFIYSTVKYLLWETSISLI